MSHDSDTHAYCDYFTGQPKFARTAINVANATLRNVCVSASWCRNVSDIEQNRSLSDFGDGSSDYGVNYNSDNLFHDETTESLYISDDDSDAGDAYSLLTLVPFTIAYALVFLVGFLGNVATICVILTKRFMHTKTNFYLCSLAFSDVLLLVFGLPFDVAFMWQPFEAIGGNLFCVLRGYISEAATNASVLTIVAFTIERWIAICKPFRNLRNSGKVAAHIASIWTVSLIAAVPLAYQFGVRYHYNSCDCTCDQTITFCMIIEEKQLSYLFDVSFLLFFIVPMIFIAGFYGLIIRELRSSMNVARNSQGSPLMELRIAAKQQIQARKLVIKMLLVVVMVFFVCFVPLHVQRLITVHTNNYGDAGYVAFLKLLYAVSGFLYYLSTAVNPIIYNLLSRKFRVAFASIITHCSKTVLRSRQSGASAVNCKKTEQQPLSEVNWPSCLLQKSISSTSGTVPLSTTTPQKHASSYRKRSSTLQFLSGSHADDEIRFLPQRARRKMGVGGHVQASSAIQAQNGMLQKYRKISRSCSLTRKSRAFGDGSNVSEQVQFSHKAYGKQQEYGYSSSSHSSEFDRFVIQLLKSPTTRS